MNKNYIEMKSGQLLDLQRSGAIDRLRKQPLPIKSSYLLRILLSAIRAELSHLNSSHDELFTPENSDEIDGGRRQMKPEFLRGYFESLGSLRDLDVKIQATPVYSDDLACVIISEEDLEMFGPLIVRGKDE